MFFCLSEWNCLNGHTWWCFSGSISKAETIDAVASASLPKDVASQVFDYYFEKRDNQCEYSAKERELCAFFGEYLLQTGTSFHFDEFSKLWQQAVPGGDDKTNVEVDGVLETDRYSFRTDISQVNSLSIFCHRNVCSGNPIFWRIHQSPIFGFLGVCLSSPEEDLAQGGLFPYW